MKRIVFVLLCFFATVVLANESFPVIFESTHRAMLPAQQPGKIAELHVDIGDNIKPGQTLAIIEHDVLLHEKNRLNAIVQFLTTKANNIQELYLKGLSSDIELAEIQKEKAVAEAEKDAIDVKIAQSFVKAPFIGKVIKRHVQPFEWVNAGQPVIEVLDIKKIRATAFLPAALTTQLKGGEEHSIEVLDLKETVTGKLYSMTPSIDVRSNTIQVVWHFETLPKALRAGMKGQIVFHPVNTKL